MIWMDYIVQSGHDCFTVKGDWPGEVMGLDKEGNPGAKTHPLYQPGDIYKVNNDGWLIKIGEDRDDV